jgi:hypothetical protein
MIRVDANERLAHDEGERICDANQYAHYTRFSNGRDACLASMVFTVAILSDLTRWGYGDRWCYETFDKALNALIDWQKRDGEGEPTGWHRHPDTGRRRPDGDASKEYIDL